MKEYNAVVEVPSIESNLVPIFLGKIGDIAAHVCDARTLHAFLGVGKRFASWIKERIEEYGFVENQDFVSFSQNGEKPQGGRPTTDYHLSLDMAKELSMVERNDKGREARRYFIECERRALAAVGQTLPLPRLRPEKTRKALPGKLTIEQQDAVKALVKSRVEIMPHEQQAKTAITCWSAIKSKFGVSYKEVPAEQFADVLSLVARLELDKAQPKALPFHVHYPMETAAPPLGEKGLGHYAFAAESKWNDPEWDLLMKLRDAGFNVDGPIYSYQAKIHLVRAMYTGLIERIGQHFHVACTIFPYAPLYIR
jgi:phage anti-repressor protein